MHYTLLLPSCQLRIASCAVCAVCGKIHVMDKTSAYLKMIEPDDKLITFGETSRLDGLS